MTVKRERIRYTAEQKQAVVARMMPPQNEAVGKIHEETKITEATLYKWRKEARAWALKFIRWYNEVHLHSALKFVTPVQCHMGEHIDILEKRKEVYEEAKQKHPERWARQTRNWSAQEQVALNPMKVVAEE